MPIPSIFGPDADASFLEETDLPVSFAVAGADEPLSYVNPAFERLTGYAAADCIGRNCRFLQGPDTDPSAVERVREGIDAREYRLTALINHRVDGSAFTNALLVGPLTDADGRTLALFGAQWDVDETLSRRRARLGKAHWESAGPSVRLDRFERLVHLTLDASRERDPDAGPMAFVERLVAISRPHHYPPRGDRLPNWTRADSLLPFLLEPHGREPFEALRFEDAPDIVAVDLAYALSLAVQALVRATRERTDACGRADRAELHVRCRSAALGGEPVLELGWRVAGPPGADPVSARARAGLDVAAGLVERLGGTFEVELERARLDATLRLPNRPYGTLGDA